MKIYLIRKSFRSFCVKCRHLLQSKASEEVERRSITGTRN